MIRIITVVFLIACGQGLRAQEPDFGGPEDTAYADALWQQMLTLKLVGDDLEEDQLYTGVQPHGFVLENLVAEATLEGRTGALVVKRNYGPSGIDMAVVERDRVAALKAVTVMFSRDASYDPGNQNWFYAKYRPDGSLDKNPKGVPLAGRVAKGVGPDGTDAGCIACHRAAPGNDFLFVTDLGGS